MAKQLGPPVTIEKERQRMTTANCECEPFGWYPRRFARQLWGERCTWTPPQESRDSE